MAQIFGHRGDKRYPANVTVQDKHPRDHHEAKETKACRVTLQREDIFLF